MTRYFAYGANMDPLHMAERCPTARRLGTAELPGHRFTIAAKGYGNAAVAPHGVVRGVLWELQPADEAALDAFEGVPEGLYRKEFAVVRDCGGFERRAMLYMPADPAPGLPVPGYLERIIEVAESLGFPRAYLAELQELLGAH